MTRLSVVLVVSFVSVVSGFAQTNNLNIVTVSDRERVRSAANISRPYVALRSATYDNVELPDNVSVPSFYASVVEQMLLKSPTFRRQCLRIGSASSLRVVISSETLPTGTQAMAWTEITRGSHGDVRAIVRIGKTTRPAELIAHEFEHIIEQLDGVNLQVKALNRSTGVHRCQCTENGAYETLRAIQTGQRVLDEVLSRNP